MIELEAILETDIRKLGDDFTQLKAYFVFKDGREFPVNYQYEMFEITKIRFKVNVTGIDINAVSGMIFRDKEGKARMLE